MADQLSLNRPSFQAPRHIVIEGPIRVGKSTLAKVLGRAVPCAPRSFDCEDNPFLADFYDEKPGAAFRAQMYFLYERHRRLSKRSSDDRAAPIVSDFLFEKDKIFAYINLDNEELKLYEKYFDMLAPSVRSLPTWSSISKPSRRSCESASRKRAILRRQKFLPNTSKLSPTPTSTSSSAIPLRICSSWTHQKSTSSSAIRICRSFCAASASPSRGRSISFRWGRARRFKRDAVRFGSARNHHRSNRANRKRE